MDILYQLPFPQEVCSKIFMYACKSPHTGLGVAILKKIIGLSIYNKLIKNGGIMLDGDGNVVEFRMWDKHSNNLLDDDERKQLIFDIAHLKSLPNLTYIDLSCTGVTGDIKNLKSLPKLTEINIYDTGVTGNIVHLESLPNLTEISLGCTGVTGNIAHLKSLPKLTEIWLCNTRVSGNIADLNSLLNLTEIDLRRTDVSGDKEEAFHNYRKSAGFTECEVYT